MDTHPRLQEMDAELRAANDALFVLRGRRAELVLHLVNEALGTDHRQYDLDHCRSWSCPDDMLERGEEASSPRSPTGHCVFLPKEDPGRLRCLFCGGPEERQ